MELRKKKTTEKIRRRKGIDSFVKSLGSKALEYGKERIRDYPKEVASGWKSMLGFPKAEIIPDSFSSTNISEAIKSGEINKLAPVAESVGGLSVTIPQALKQLGKSASKLSLKGKAVRSMATNIKRTPEEVLEPLTSVKYTDRLPPLTTGRNVRIGQRPGDSKIQLAPEAGAQEWFHELTHGAAAKGQAGARAEGKPTLKQYMSDLLESTTAVGDEAVARTPAMKGRSFYKDQPIETHARKMAETLTDYGGKFTTKQYDRLFVNKAKQVMRDVNKEAPTLYKKTTKMLGKHYKSIRKSDAELLKELNIKNLKSKKELPGLPMKTEDIIELIKKLPKKDLKKVKIKRKAD